MGSLYTNPKIQPWVDQTGVLDQFLRLSIGTCEQVFSLTFITDPYGMVAVVISCDVVYRHETEIHGHMIARYPLHQQPQALADAKMLAGRYKLPLRGATGNQGWVELTADSVLMPIMAHGQ